MKSIITAIGIATPSKCFPQMKIFDFMVNAHQLNPTEASRLKRIYEVSGIDQRYSVLNDFDKAPDDYTFFGNNKDLDPFPGTKERSDVYEKHASSLSIAAVKDLLRKLPDFDLATITHLITVSCTGMYAPGLDIDLVEMLGLNKSVERTCINFMGCYGAFNAFKIADYCCRAEPKSKVLIVDIELCTLHFQHENRLDNWVANSLFADGAAAVLVEGERSNKSGFILNSFYSELALEAKNEMAWRIVNTGFQMRLSSKITKSIQSKIQSVTDKLLNKSGLSLSDVSKLAVHPGGRRILEVCKDTLNFSDDSIAVSFDILKSYGNMSSATILFVLERLFKKTNTGENIISYAFGPGLTIESMMLKKI